VLVFVKTEAIVHRVSSEISWYHSGNILSLKWIVFLRNILRVKGLWYCFMLRL